MSLHKYIRYVLIAVCVMVLSSARLPAEELSFIPAGETEPEPYLLEKPDSIEKGKRYPLIIYLHGRGQGHKFQWLSREFAAFRMMAAERGYYVLIPHLGTDHWMNARTRVVLTELLDKTVKSNPIDPAQVHLMGMSMGGGGSLIYTMHNRDRVRSVCNIFGVTDYTRFWQQRPRYNKSMSEALGGTPETKPEVYEAQSVMKHLDKLRTLPVLLLHGDADTVVPVDQSKRFVMAMMQGKHKVTYNEVKGGKHLMSFLNGLEEEILDFFDTNTSTK